MEVKEIKKILDAFEKGEHIEYRCHNVLIREDDKWRPLNVLEPVWDFNNFEYRVAQVPKIGDTYGWYFIRDFDYLPESLQAYPHNFTRSMWDAVKRGKFVLFNNIEDARKASNKIRMILDLEPLF